MLISCHLKVGDKTVGTTIYTTVDSLRKYLETYGKVFPPESSIDKDSVLDWVDKKSSRCFAWITFHETLDPRDLLDGEFIIYSGATDKEPTYQEFCSFKYILDRAKEIADTKRERAWIFQIKNGEEELIWWQDPDAY